MGSRETPQSDRCYRNEHDKGGAMQTPAPFGYERATSVDHAIQLLEQLGPDARLIAGGHSFLPMMKLRLAQPEHVIDINPLYAELGSIAIESNQLVTILGDGETLALTVGAQLADEFADGVWWVEMESVEDPTRLVEKVALDLRIRQDQDRPLTVLVIEHLREKNLLLLLSHCDRLLGAVAQLAETILRTCPDVRILATSQQPLNVSVEKRYPLVGASL